MKYGYARVSTETQNLNLQLNALKNCDKIYKEKVGALGNRTELYKLLSTVKAGDILMVYKLDRLGRSTIDLINIITMLKEKGVEFISITDNIDTSTATGKLIFTVFAAFAQFERDLISERTKAGLQALKDKGKKLGPDYKWDEKTVKEVISLRKQRVKVGFISKKLGIPRSTIYYFLAVRGK